MNTVQEMTVYLLSIRGTLAPTTLENARSIHNSTAGAPPNVAAARSLGDVSHMVYVPMEHDHDHAGTGAGEFLILDQWNNLDGLNQFFANPHVQEQAGQIFSDRDPVVWAPATGFMDYHFPAPYGKNDRFVGVVRGMVKSRVEAMKVHNALVESSVNKSRIRGNISHEVFFRLMPPGSPESLELFAVEVWYNGAGMGEHYEDPEFLPAFENMFASEPSASVWVHPTGEWVEW